MRKYWIPAISSITAFLLVVLMLGLMKPSGSESLLIDAWDSVKWMTFALIFNFQLPFWVARISVLLMVFIPPILIFLISKDLLSRLFKYTEDEYRALNAKK
ncbi:MAG: hypothetical protein ACRCZ4_00340 [Plesiomonas sp.]|uniref:hypothetical protein n=1 Tax=Plesiomonas sp. TaxID=2486279 RepID=UPI003EE580D4